MGMTAAGRKALINDILTGMPDRIKGMERGNINGENFPRISGLHQGCKGNLSSFQQVAGRKM
jgi:hypothetical protein